MWHIAETHEEYVFEVSPPGARLNFIQLSAGKLQVSQSNVSPRGRTRGGDVGAEVVIGAGCGWEFEEFTVRLGACMVRVW